MNTLSLLQEYLKTNNIKTRNNMAFGNEAIFHKASNGNSFHVQLTKDQLILVVRVWSDAMLGHELTRLDLADPNSFDKILRYLKIANKQYE